MLTQFEQLFKDTLLTLTDDIDEIYAEYLFAKTDSVRQKIIDGIKNGSIKNMDDVGEITIKMSPIYTI